MNKIFEQLKSYYAELIPLTLSIISVIIFMLVNNDKELVSYLEGGLRSIFQFGLITIVLSVLISSACGFIFPKKNNELTDLIQSKPWKAILVSIPIILAYTILSIIAGLIVGYMINVLFPGLLLRTFTAALLIAASAFLAGYWVYGRVSKFNLKKASTIFLLIFLSSLMIAITFVGVDEWWAYHISFLGGDSSYVSRFFNFSIVFSGILALIIVFLLSKRLKLFVEKGMMTDRKYKILVICGYLIGIFFMGIGFFPYIPGTFEAVIHNLCAYALAVIFTFIMVFSSYFFNFLPKGFFIKSAICSAAMIFTGILFVVFGYFNVLGAELAAFTIAFLWFSFLLEEIQKKVKKIKREEKNK